MANIPARSLHTASGADIDILVAEGPCTTRDLPPPRSPRDHVREQPDAMPVDELRRQGLRQDF